MPQNNKFRHQQYPPQPRQQPTRCILNSSPEPVDFLRLHTHSGLRQVVLVPGTFAGDDPFAVGQILRALGQRIPGGTQLADGLSDKLAAQTKRFVESTAGDVGSWTDDYCKRFSDLVDGSIEVKRLEPTWSGQNHHFARADLAVRLVCHLDALDLYPGEQILFWGHSHAGNGFAILSNLLANHRSAVESFFDACEPLDDDPWQRAQQILASGATPHRLANHVSFAAFGTPVRYGWDTAGYRQLIHILFDRGHSGDAFTTQPLFPPHTLRDTVDATWGDWVQAFGIAGTDVVPPTPQSIERDRKLQMVLEAGLEPPPQNLETKLIPGQKLRDLCSRWKTGTRCHADGTNLLVDYRPCGRSVLNRPVEISLFGHGVATTVDWLPAHLALVQERLTA